MRARELYDTQLFEVIKCEGLHLVVTQAFEVIRCEGLHLVVNVVFEVIRCEGLHQVVLRCLKSSGVRVFTWSSLRWFQSVLVRTKKDFLCWTGTQVLVTEVFEVIRCEGLHLVVTEVFEVGDLRGLEFGVTCLPMVFFTVQSRHFIGLVSYFV